MAVLVDPCGRKLDYLRVSVVDSCNLRCFYCRPGDSCKPRGVRPVLSREWIVRIVQAAAAAGIRKVRITGGEPLLRRDILDIVREIAGIEGIADVSLTTNGTRLARMAKPLKEAGLNRVNISLDSLDGTNFRQITRGGRLETTLEGIDAAFAAGLMPVKINMVVLKGLNDAEVENFARLTLRRALHVRFIEYMPMQGTQVQWRKHFLPSAEIMELCRRVGELEVLPEDDFGGPASNYAYPGAAGKLGFITPVSRHFCSLCNRLRLTSDGKLKPCLFGEEEIDLRQALEEGKDLLPYFQAAAGQKPVIPEQSPAARGALRGPRGMVEIGG